MSGGYQEIEAPDGTVIEFPDYMSTDEIKGVMRRKYMPRIDVSKIKDDNEAISEIDKLPEYARQQALKDYATHSVTREREKGGVLQGIDDHVRMFSQQAPLVGEWLDEANAATSSLFGGSYDLELQKEHARRAAIDAAKRAGMETPFGRVDTGDLAKGAGVAAGLVAGPVANAARLGVVGNAAATGAAYTAADVAGATDGNLIDRLGAAATAAPLGAATGVAGGITGRALGNYANRINYGTRGQQPVSSGVLKDAEARAYQGARNADVIFEPRMGQSISARVNRELRDMTYDPLGRPKTDAAIQPLLRKVEDLRYAGPPATQGRFSGSELEGLRSEAARAAFKSSAPRTRELANRVVRSIDGAIDDVATRPARAQRLVTQGNVNQFRDSLISARQLHHVSEKTRTVENAMRKAADRAHGATTLGNQNATTRRAFEQIVSDKNLSRSFNPNELAAMRQVIESTPANAALRVASNLGPNGLTAITAVATGNPYFAAMMGVGWAAKQLGNRQTASAARKVLAGISNGNMPTYYTRFQRAARMYRAGRLSGVGLKMAAQMTATQLARDTGSDYQKTFEAMYNDTLKTGPKNKPLSDLLPGFGG